MLRRVAAKYAPFEFETVVITIQPCPVVTFNQKESICELRLTMNIRNSSLYDLKLLFCQVDLEMNGDGLSRLESAKMLLLPRLKDDTLILSKPLTEFEYKRALNLFGQQSIQKCQCYLSLQIETTFGQQNYERKISTSIDLRQS